MPNINLAILNQKSTPAFFADTLANRPAPSFVGRVFISTDTYDLYRDTGTAWDLLSPSAAAGVTGTGVANQVAFWNGTTQITGDSGLTYDSSSNLLSGISADFTSSGSGNTFDITHSSGSGIALNISKNGNGEGLIVTKGSGSGNAATINGGLVRIENNSNDAQLQIVSSIAPSLRIDNASIGATQRIGLGLATTTNNFIQGTTGGELCLFNSSTTASPILFGIWNGVNTQEAGRFSAARNFLLGQTADTGQTLQVTGTAAITGITQFSNTGAFVGFPGVTINQGSGTGIALSITKDGNNEGLYVNKTSGTGNAVTIIGTLNATTLVKSGGTSAQILAADGSVITAGTGITISGGTISATATGGITGSGTTSYIPLFNSTTNITNSNITQVSTNIFIGASYGQTKKLNVNGDIDLTGVLTNSGTQIINVANGTLAIGDGTGKLNSTDIIINTGTFTIDIGNAFAPYTLNNYGSITGTSFIKDGGTSAQILAADGSVITAGTGITISGGTISSSGGGGITGSGTANTIPLFNAGTNITNSNITQVSTNIFIGGSYGQTKKLNVNGDIDLTGVLTNNGTQIINVGTGYLALGDGTGKLNTSDILVDNALLNIEIGGAFTPYTLNNYGNVVFSGLPTSSAGLPSGSLWRNGTSVDIVP